MRTRTVKIAMAGTLILLALGTLVLGAQDVGATARQRSRGERAACLRQALGGSKVRTALDSLVQDGTLTPAQEQAVLDKLVGEATDVGACTGWGLMRDHAVGKAVADLLGMDRGEIKQAWQDGRSLTEIAQSKGVTRDQLVTTIHDAIDKKLQTAVDKGKLTAERKTQIMNTIDPIIETAVDLHRGDRLRNGGAATPVPPATPAATSANVAAL